MTTTDSAGVFTRERILTLVLGLLTLIVLYVNYQIVEPFIPAVAFALALAVATRTPFVWLNRRIGMRGNTAAAILAVILVAVVIIAPAASLTRYVVQTAMDGMDEPQKNGGIETLRDKFDRIPILGNWFREHASGLELEQQITNLGRTLGARASGILSGSLTFFTQLGVTLFVLFFLYRDRRSAMHVLRKMLPLSNPEADRLFSRISDTINATVNGSLTVALVQASLAGAVYLLLGVPLAVLWAAATFFMALTPVLGTFSVWAPIALWLAMTGHVAKTMFLLIWGAGVVASVDNILYPYLVGGKLRLHTVPTFFSVLGGVRLFGPAGLILGPMAMAVAIALLDVWFRRTEHGQAAEEAIAADKPDGRERPESVLQEKTT